MRAAVEVALIELISLTILFISFKILISYQISIIYLVEEYKLARYTLMKLNEVLLRKINSTDTIVVIQGNLSKIVIWVEK
ncbi:MAG: hypothetical protein DRJ52_00090 [Thermoprotei archaeon]|nr:MAG: hypothetical protein DRJ52_00090 [Thermoprotei archaeon]